MNKKVDLFDDFIFPDRLSMNLRMFLKRPEILRVTPILCFYGFPGVGKTSFGKLLLNKHCSDVQYFPMNERSLTNNFIEEKIKPLFRTVSLFDDQKLFSRGIFLDEFHNLRPKDQDRFKVVFDDLVERENTLVIVGLNVTRTKNLSRSVTEPIYSRLHPINFNVRDSREEIDEVVDRVMNRYPLLNRDLVRCWVPDMRRISREGVMSQLMKVENRTE